MNKIDENMDSFMSEFQNNKMGILELSDTISEIQKS